MNVGLFAVFLRSTKLIAGILRFLSSVTFNIWRYIRIIASNPAAWFVVCMAPIIDLIVQLLTGYSVLFSPLINQALEIMFDLIRGYFTGDYDINGALSSLPPKGLEVARYLGLIGALQNFVNGLIHMMIVFITIKITIYTTKLKISLMTRGRIKL